MATDWRVVSQRQTDVLTPAGTFESSMEVSFEVMPEGTSGQVVVPLRIYDVDTVASLIQQRVNSIKAVAGL
jgi:hypothetical protein